MKIIWTDEKIISPFDTIKKQFTRKEYLRNFKEISPATASRDLQYATENKMTEKTGDKNTAKYRFK